MRLDLGGGGGSKQGEGNGPGNTGPQEPGEKGGQDDVTVPGLNENVPKVKLDKFEIKKVQDVFTKEDARYIAESNSETAKALARLQESFRKSIAARPASGQGRGRLRRGRRQGQGQG